MGAAVAMVARVQTGEGAAGYPAGEVVVASFLLETTAEQKWGKRGIFSKKRAFANIIYIYI